jgi:hypothetical protein
MTRVYVAGLYPKRINFHMYITKFIFWVLGKHRWRALNGGTTRHRALRPAEQMEET